MMPRQHRPDPAFKQMTTRDHETSSRSYRLMFARVLDCALYPITPISYNWGFRNMSCANGNNETILYHFDSERTSTYQFDKSEKRSTAVRVNFHHVAFQSRYRIALTPINSANGELDDETNSVSSIDIECVFPYNPIVFGVLSETHHRPEIKFSYIGRSGVGVRDLTKDDQFQKKIDFFKMPQRYQTFLRGYHLQCVFPISCDEIGLYISRVDRPKDNKQVDLIQVYSVNDLTKPSDEIFIRSLRRSTALQTKPDFRTSPNRKYLAISSEESYLFYDLEHHASMPSSLKNPAEPIAETETNPRACGIFFIHGTQLMAWTAEGDCLILRANGLYRYSADALHEASISGVYPTPKMIIHGYLRNLAVLPDNRIALHDATKADTIRGEKITENIYANITPGYCRFFKDRITFNLLSFIPTQDLNPVIIDYAFDYVLQIARRYALECFIQNRISALEKRINRNNDLSRNDEQFPAHARNKKDKAISEYMLEQIRVCASYHEAVANVRAKFPFETEDAIEYPVIQRMLGDAEEIALLNNLPIDNDVLATPSSAGLFRR